jgi:hypothetical protein
LPSPHLVFAGILEAEKEDSGIIYESDGELAA